MSGNEREATDLEYWLANEDWYMSRYTMHWLENTPPEQAAEILVGLADGAHVPPRSLWVNFLNALSVTGFFPSGAIAGQGPRRQKIGIRAALMLAGLRDPRCLPPLVRAFETEPRWQHKYQELIERALLDYLDAEEDPIRLHPYTDSLQRLCERLETSRRPRRDLPPRRALLLNAAHRQRAHQASLTPAGR